MNGKGNRKQILLWMRDIHAESTNMAKIGTRELGSLQLIDPVTQLHAQV